MSRTVTPAGREIVRLRTKKGWSQERLIEEIERVTRAGSLTLRTLQYMEGGNQCYLRSLSWVAAALGCTAETLLMEPRSNNVSNKDDGTPFQSISEDGGNPDKALRSQFSNATHDQEFSKVSDNLVRQKDVGLENRHRQPYITVPPLPPNYVDRPEELQALRAAIIGDKSARRVALTALKGMAGIGKTVLAQALCFDEITQAAFPDGIIWLTLGKDPRELLPLFREAAKVIGDSLEGYDTLQAASNRLRHCIRDKAALVVLDDVWNPRDAAPFLFDSLRSRLIITTRDTRTAVALGARQHELTVLNSEQSLRLLSLWADCEVTGLPPEAVHIIDECACLPLALAMVGAQLRGKPHRWKNFLQRLRDADLERIRHSFPEYPHPDLLRAIDVSLEALDDDLRRRYLDFAVFPEDSGIPEAAVQTLWNVEQSALEDSVDELVDLSLATRDSNQHLRIHDLLLDYLRHRLGTERLVERHQEFLRRYFEKCPRHWSQGPPDGYFFENLIWHLRKAHRTEEAVDLLLDFRWIDAKLRACGVIALIGDFEWCLNRDHNLRLVQEALRLSAYVLQTDEAQLAGQLLGRLPIGLSRSLDSIRTAADGSRNLPWFRPLRQLLTAPGGPLMFTLASHTAGVRSVALSANGRRAISASDDHTLKLWDLKKGTLERTLLGHSDTVRAVAMLQGEARIISASDDHTIRVWDLATGRQEGKINTHVDWIRALVVLPDGLHIASISDDRSIKVWNLKTLSVERLLEGHAAEINDLAPIPRGPFLASGSDDRTVRLWNLSQYNCERVMARHSSRVVALAVAGHDTLLSASSDGVLQLCGIQTQECRILKWRVDGLRSVSLTPDGTIAVAASDDNNLHVWDLTSSEERILAGHSDWVNCVAATTDGRCVVSASDDGTLKVWDLTRMADVGIRDHSEPVRALAVTPDCLSVISTSDDHTLRIWDAVTRTVRRKVSCHHWAFSCMPNRNEIVSADADGGCRVWDLHSNEEIGKFQKHTDRVRCLDIAACGDRVVTAGDDSTIRVWDCRSGKQTLCIALARQWPRAIALTPDGKFALTAAESNNLKLWDLVSGSEIRTFRGHNARVNALAITRDGKCAISCSDDHNLCLWDLEGGKVVRFLKGHEARVNTLSLMPGDEFVISGSDDGEIRLWNLGQDRPLARFTIESPILASAVNSQTSEVVIGDRSGLVHFFELRW